MSRWNQIIQLKPPNFLQTFAAATLPVLLLSGCAAGPITGGSRASESPLVAGIEQTVTPSAEPTQSPPSVEPTSTQPINLPVFVYHHVKPDADNFIAITPTTFEEHLKTLKRHGYTTITVAELHAHLTRGVPLPERPVMLTFDDGWRNQYDHAVPLLEKYGMQGSFFVYPKTLKGGPYMTRGQISELASAGHDIGNHTWGHTALQMGSEETTKAFAARARKMLEPASDWIEDAIGHRPVGFAYPFGYYDLQSAAMLAPTGLDVAFTVDEGPNEIGSPDGLMLKRFTVFKEDSIEDFEVRLLSRPLHLQTHSPQSGSTGSGSTQKLSATLAAVEAGVTELSFLVDNEPVSTKDELVGGIRTARAQCDMDEGFHYVTLTGLDSDGTRAYASWGINVR